MSNTSTTRLPWEWRKASPIGVLLLDSDRRLGRRIFHAYDANDNAACCVGVGLVESDEEPNEGSELCLDCIEFVRENRSGRERRVAAASGETT